MSYIELLTFLSNNNKEIQKMYSNYKRLPRYVKIPATTFTVAFIGSVYWLNVMQPRQKLLESIMKDINSNNDGNLTRYKAMTQHYKDNGYIYKDKFSKDLFVKFASQRLSEAMTNDVNLLFGYYTNGPVRKALETGAWNNGIPISYAMFSPSANSCEEATLFTYLAASHIARLQKEDKMNENEFHDKATNSMEFYKRFANDFIFHLPKCKGYVLQESEIAVAVEEIVQHRYKNK